MLDFKKSTEEIYKMVEKIGGRKMFLAIILFLTATLCLFLDVATFSEWSEFTKWLFGIFAVGNFGEHMGKQFGGKDNEK